MKIKDCNKNKQRSSFDYNKPMIAWIIFHSRIFYLKNCHPFKTLGWPFCFLFFFLSGDPHILKIIIVQLTDMIKLKIQLIVSNNNCFFHSHMEMNENKNKTMHLVTDGSLICLSSLLIYVIHFLVLIDLVEMSFS